MRGSGRQCRMQPTKSHELRYVMCFSGKILNGGRKSVTLIATLVSHYFCAQVSDTRLTWPSGDHRDGAVKTIIVRCRDATLALSYTGLAKIGHQKTDRWLAYHLYKMKTWEMSFPEVPERLADQLTAAARLHRGLVQ